MWEILQKKVYKTRITYLDKWNSNWEQNGLKSDHVVIAAAIRRWHRHVDPDQW